MHQSGSEEEKVYKTFSKTPRQQPYSQFKLQKQGSILANVHQTVFNEAIIGHTKLEYQNYGEVSALSNHVLFHSE